MSNKKQYVRLRDDVFRATNYMLAEQGAVISGIPGVKMNRTAYVNELVMNDLSKRGHYPPKDKEPDENDQPS